MITQGFSKISITKDIYSLLSANTGLTSYVGDNIYPVEAPEADSNGNEIKDVVVFFKDKSKTMYTQNNIVVNMQCDITFAIISSAYFKSVAIAELVNEIIEGIHENTDGYKYQCRLVDSDEFVTGLNNDKYLQVLVFELK